MMDISAPLNAQIELTSDCNHKCIYCYNPWDRYTKTSSMNPSDLEIVIDKLADASVMGAVLTGGEPLLEKEVVYAGISRSLERDMDVSVNTNMSRLDNTFLKMMSDNELSFLGSFPSHDKKTYNKITQSKNYQKVVEKIGIAIDYDLPIFINTVVCTENQDQIYETGQFLFSKFGIERFSATPVNPSKKEHLKFTIDKKGIKQSLEDLISLEQDYGMKVDVLDVIPNCLFGEEYRDYPWFWKKGCNAGITTIAVSSEGDVRPCTHVEWSAGNLIQEDFEDIWKRMSGWREEEFLPEYCSPCEISDSCRGGCRSRAKTVNGEYKSRDPLARKQFIEPLEPKKIGLEKEYRLIELKTRKEEVGTLITDGFSSIIGNDAVIDMIKLLREERKIVPSEFMDKYGFSDIGKSFLDVLYQNNFLREKR